MKEMLEIVTAFESLAPDAKLAALATVIDVEGSAYRRPGARMLIAEDGRTWGGISGGCLERDVARRALGVIDSGRPLRCRYDTGDDEAIANGTATGCGGTVELLIQRVTSESPGPIRCFAQLIQTRKPLRLRTVTRTGSDHPLPAGSCTGTFLAESSLLASRRPRLIGDAIRGEVFVEELTPPQALVVFGAGPDVVPLVTIAKTLGWHVSVVGSRPATGITERFAMADSIHVTASDDPLAGVWIPPDAAVAVMTHNLARDIAILSRLRGPVRYLGLLGPRHRTRKVIAQLPSGALSDIDSNRIFAPIGLDLSADAPPEIALAIVAEIQASLRGGSGRSLKTRPGPIHRAGSNLKPVKPRHPIKGFLESATWSE